MKCFCHFFVTSIPSQFITSLLHSRSGRFELAQKQGTTLLPVPQPGIQNTNKQEEEEEENEDEKDRKTL